MWVLNYVRVFEVYWALGGTVSVCIRVLLWSRCVMYVVHVLSPVRVEK